MLMMTDGGGLRHVHARMFPSRLLLHLSQTLCVSLSLSDRQAQVSDEGALVQWTVMFRELYAISRGIVRGVPHSTTLGGGLLCAGLLHDAAVHLRRNCYARWLHADGGVRAAHMGQSASRRGGILHDVVYS